MTRDPRAVTMAASLAIAFLMLGGKLAAYFITGSVAILSDAAESVVHLFATSMAAFSLWYAKRPASRRHPYGYGKIAYFSAGFEGALILSAALVIFWVSAISLIRGPELKQLDWGLAITGALALVNLALGLSLVMVGKRKNSLILVANGHHVLTDMWTSFGVIVGVGLVWVTGILWLDPLTAILAASNILYAAYGLIRRSFGGLLDAAAPELTGKILERLDQAIEEGTIVGYHQVRHRGSNDEIWMDAHMLLPAGMPLSEAHERVTRIENSIKSLFPNYEVYITTHIEPAPHEDGHPEGHPGKEDPLAAGT